ncbi:MAG: methyltransferase domain-containing protein [Gammaproteobacteria bacterium]
MADNQKHEYVEVELLYNRYLEPGLREALNFLPFPKDGGIVLDAGCGPGGLFSLLLDASGPGGKLVAIDCSGPHLKAAEAYTASHGLLDCIELTSVDMQKPLPYPNSYFDGIWSSDVITPDDFEDIPTVVTELVRVLKPGGFLALFYGNWVRQQLLPGYSRLEHRIGIAREYTFAKERAWEGESHPECALRWLREAGCESTRLRLITVSYDQPLPADVRRYLADYSLGTFYENAIQEFGTEAGMDAADSALWRRLSDPASADFILDREDYFCTQVTMLAVGRKPLSGM